MGDVREEALWYAALCRAAGSEEKVLPLWEGNPGETAAALGLDASLVTQALAFHRPAFEALGMDTGVIGWDSPLWPAGTKDSSYCPRYLYLQGDVSLIGKISVSLIGTLRPTVEGKRLAIETVETLAKSGVGIAGSLDAGIPGIVQIAALRAGVPPLCVLGTPLGVSENPAHEKLQRLIAQNGLLVSRFPPGTVPEKWHLILRNRLLSSLTAATAVIEERDGGGAVQQAAYALKQGRRVFIFPLSADNPALLWPRRLSRADPRVVTVRNGKEIARRVLPEKKRNPRPKKGPSPDQLSLF